MKGIAVIMAKHIIYGIEYMPENRIVYVGQTSFSMEHRFAQHLNDCRSNKIAKDKKLYVAMRNFGISNFRPVFITETDNPDFDERQYIGLYDTYRNGFNMTIGGQGKERINKSAVIKQYNSGLSIRQVAKSNKCSTDAVSNILSDAGITAEERQRNGHKFLNKKVSQFSLDGKYINTFESCHHAARDVFGKDSCNAGINKCARGLLKEYCGYFWKFA